MDSLTLQWGFAVYIVTTVSAKKYLVFLQYTYAFGAYNELEVQPQILGVWQRIDVINVQIKIKKR